MKRFAAALLLALLAFPATADPPAIFSYPPSVAGPTGATGAAGPANLTTSVLAADATSITATMAATGLTVSVTGGVRYAFMAVLMLNDNSTAQASGAKFDFDASTSAATNFRVWTDDGAIGAFTSAFTTALATDIANSGPFTDDRVLLTGGFEPTADGTFAIRFAQNVRVDGTLTLFRGSSLTIWRP